MAQKRRKGSKADQAKPAKDTGSVSHNTGNASDQIEFFRERLVDRIASVTDHVDRSVFIEEYGWSKNTLANYRKGANVPGSEALAQIVNATGCDPGWLLTGRGDAFPGRAVDTDDDRAALEASLGWLLASLTAAGHAARHLLPYLSQSQSARLAATIADLPQALTTATPPPAPPGSGR